VSRDRSDEGREPAPRAEWPTPLVVLVDDTRDFKDARPTLTARTSAEAVELLRRLAGTRIDELWLDYDLSLGDTAQPVVDHLVTAAAAMPQEVGRILVHSSNIRHGHRITAELAAAGYPARRSYAAAMFVRARRSPPRS
jgi:hypothetical protein